jgi:alcohol dehydrogenase class IV
MTPVWGMTEAGRKTTGSAPEVLPRIVLYDPELTVTLPAAITGPSAMNAMAHCVEAFYAPGASPITSLMAEEAIGALGRGAPAAVERPRDLDARAEVLYGAWLAGAAFAVAGSGLHHKICHVLGGAYDLPHADMHTVVLPHVAAFQAPAVPAAMERVARALGASDAGAAAPAIHALNERIGAPRGLRDIGMREADLDEAAGLVMEKVPPDNPRPVDEEAIRALLGDAFAGRPPRSQPAAAMEASR